MEEPRHKIMRGTMGALFIVGIILILVMLYVYYFSPRDYKPNNDGTSTSSEDTFTPSVDSQATDGASSNVEQPPAADSSRPVNSSNNTATTTPGKANFDASTNSSDPSSTYQQIQNSNFDER